MRPERVAFLAIGTVLGLLCLLAIHAEWRFGQGAARVPGTVIGLRAGGSHPEIAYETPLGERMTFTGQGLIAGYETGDRVSVLLDPARPRRGSLDSFGARYGFEIGGVLLAAAFIAVGSRRRT